MTVDDVFASSRTIIVAGKGGVGKTTVSAALACAAAQRGLRVLFIELDGKRFFRTGDMGRIDEDGYFFITDRLKRMINASGFKVWPAEVEAMLHRHPAVKEACVIASRDAYRGETVKALVVLREGQQGQVSEQDIIRWTHEHMAAYKSPRLIEFVSALPKSGSGKILWRELQAAEQTSGDH